ncbi:MAG: potassium channel protein [Crocinitomicaceae bacterium]
MLLNYKIFAKIYYAFALLFLVILTGTIGFSLVEGWNLVDSFYMTIITVSTVGYGEVQELSEAGKIFTSFLIITSFGTFAFAVTSITSYLVGGEYKLYFKDYKVNKKIENLQGHTIICGYGRVGRQAAADMVYHKEKVVVIETNDDLVDQNMVEDSNFFFLRGDATVDENLEKAGIARAKALITALPKDSDNLFVVLSARTINPKLKIISRSSNMKNCSKLSSAGANNVIMPDTVGGSHMASLVTTPDVMEFLDLIKISGKNEINIEEITFRDLPPDFQFKTIAELDAKKITGCNIVGYRAPNGDYQINPSPELKMVPDSKLFVLGNATQIEHLNRLFGLK